MEYSRPPEFSDPPRPALLGDTLLSRVGSYTGPGARRVDHTPAQAGVEFHLAEDHLKVYDAFRWVSDHVPVSGLVLAAARELETSTEPRMDLLRSVAGATRWIERQYEESTGRNDWNEHFSDDPEIRNNAQLLHDLFDRNLVLQQPEQPTAYSRPVSGPRFTPVPQGRQSSPATHGEEGHGQAT